MSASKAPDNTVGGVKAAGPVFSHDPRLVIALVLGFLGSDVRPHDRLIKPNGGNEIAPGSEVSTGKIAATTTVLASDLDGARALEITHDVEDSVLGRNADAYVDMICHRVSLENSALVDV